jgi:hypothetical protein
VFIERRVMEEEVRGENEEALPSMGVPCSKAILQILSIFLGCFVLTSVNAYKRNL